CAHARRPPDRSSLQHVSHSGLAARSNREPRPGGDRGRTRSGAGEVPLLRRDGRDPSSLLGDDRRAQRGGRPVPPPPRARNPAIKRATWPAPPRSPKRGASPPDLPPDPSRIARSPPPS